MASKTFLIIIICFCVSIKDITMDKTMHSSHASSYQIINQQATNNNNKMLIDHHGDYNHQHQHHHIKNVIKYPKVEMKNQNLYTLAILPNLNYHQMNYVPPTTEESPILKAPVYKSNQPSYQLKYYKNELTEKRILNNKDNYHESLLSPPPPPLPTIKSPLMMMHSNKRIKYSPASLVSHVKFNGMGTSYEF